MRIVTVATQSAGYFPWLRMACARYGVPLQVLGWNERWRGFQWRSHLLREALRQMPPDEFVCFVDAYDVMLLRDPVPDMEAAFEATGARVLVICERFEGVRRLYNRAFMEYYWGRCHNQYVNAGFVAGRAGDLADHYHRLVEWEPAMHADDQLQLVRLCRRDPDAVYVDCTDRFCVLINNALGDVWDEPGWSRRSDGEVTFRGRRPFLVHATWATSMDVLIRQLGYPLTLAEAAEVRRYRWMLRLRSVRTPLVVLVLLSILVLAVRRHRAW